MFVCGPTKGGVNRKNTVVRQLCDRAKVNRTRFVVMSRYTVHTIIKQTIVSQGEPRGGIDR